VLTNNVIRRVENIEHLQTLEHLLLQGNEIASLDDLNLPLLVRCTAPLPLTAPATIRNFLISARVSQESLPKLVSLYLRNVDNSQANPVCACNEYKASILRRLPQLRNLDGERLRSSAHSAYHEAAAAPETGATERECLREREGSHTREVETPLPSNSPHDHMILRVGLVDSHGRWASIARTARRPHAIEF
jgi:hypothetical protein